MATPALEFGQVPALRWTQVLSPREWLLASVAWVPFLWAFVEYLQAPTGSTIMLSVFLIVGAVVMFAAWIYAASLRLWRVYVLTEDEGVAVWDEHWWPREFAYSLDPEFYWVINGRRRPVLDGRGPKFRPFNPWVISASEVTSEDLARALEQSAARTIFEARSRRVGETVKIAVLGMFAAGGGLLIHLILNSGQTA